MATKEFNYGSLMYRKQLEESQEALRVSQEEWRVLDGEMRELRAELAGCKELLGRWEECGRVYQGRIREICALAFPERGGKGG